MPARKVAFFKRSAPKAESKETKTMGVASAKYATPVKIVEGNNPLIRGIGKISKKWSKRWAEIDQPWPVDGTFDPEVMKTMEVLIDTYKAEQKNGSKGQKRKEKRKLEAAVLKLFDREGQKLLKVNTPFSHMSSVLSPPPYEGETASPQGYPQLPILTTEGRYLIEDNIQRIVETGDATTTIV